MEKIIEEMKANDEENTKKKDKKGTLRSAFQQNILKVLGELSVFAGEGVSPAHSDVTLKARQILMRYESRAELRWKKMEAKLADATIARCRQVSMNE